MTHIIRLRGPWLARSQDVSTTEQTEPLRFQAPAKWEDVFPESSPSGFRIWRRFGKPTGVESDAAIDLVIVPPLASGTLYLNGEELDRFTRGASELRIDVTSRLEARNELAITFDSLAADANAEIGLLGVAQLEISSRCP